MMTGWMEKEKEEDETENEVANRWRFAKHLDNLGLAGGQ